MLCSFETLGASRRVQIRAMNHKEEMNLSQGEMLSRLLKRANMRAGMAGVER